MLKKVTVFFFAIVIFICASCRTIYAFELPNLLDIASDAASSISEAAGNAKDTITDAAGKAGEAISEAASHADEAVSGAASQAGNLASSMAKRIEDAAVQLSGLASGFASNAGKVAAEWGKHAGETADGVKESLSDAGVKIKITASEFGAATAEKASEITNKAGKTANDAINAVSDAGNMVVDQAGHVVDLAAAGAGYVTSAAGAAYQMLQEKGTVLMKIAEDAVSGIDLSDPGKWESARAAVDDAIEKAYAEGVLDDQKIDRETVRIITSIVFGTMMYGYQYSDGQITLGEYASYMSEVIIREGLPTGVGFVVSILPIKVPHADALAKDATLYLITIAYTDKSGEEIEAEEDMMIGYAEVALPEGE